MWILKCRYWPRAVLAGASSERLSWLFDVRVPVDRSFPYASREWAAYSALGTMPTEHPPASASFVDSIDSHRSQPPQYDLLIHPGASAWNRKWPFSRYGELVRQLPTHYRIGVIGLPEDIVAMRSELPSDRAIEYISGSLRHAIESIASSRVALTMDSGTMFFANALRVPTVTLFGPSDPQSVLSSNSTVTPIFERKFSCQPCASTRCSQKSLYCMESIDPTQVATILLEALDSDALRRHASTSVL
jgi:ADP-heptose:LPS heptosyltransferase